MKSQEKEKTTLQAKKADLTTFVDTITHLPNSITPFNQKLFPKTVEKILVKPTSLLYYFYGDEYIRITLENAKE